MCEVQIYHNIGSPQFCHIDYLQNQGGKYALGYNRDPPDLPGYR